MSNTQTAMIIGMGPLDIMSRGALKIRGQRAYARPAIPSSETTRCAIVENPTFRKRS